MFEAQERNGYDIRQRKGKAAIVGGAVLQAITGTHDHIRSENRDVSSDKIMQLAMRDWASIPCIDGRMVLPGVVATLSHPVRLRPSIPQPEHCHL